jgi:succinoglycan biosynthesis protein ExoM
LARQTRAPRFRVIVADNDETPSAEAMVATARAELGLDIAYVHAPAHNISVARNACLGAARADILAFIDDDETAAPDWLGAILRRMATTGADVVLGPVKASYGPETPAWVVEGDFHSFGPAVRANGEIDTGYSSNVLFRRAVIGDIRFDPALGRTGGEDTLFFSQLHAAGARLDYAGDALVFEFTPPARAKLSWLMQRSYRSGQTHARMLRSNGRVPFFIAVQAGAKAGYCAGAALLTVWSPVRLRRNLVRGALHVGVMAKAFGAAEPTIYGGSAS